MTDFTVRDLRRAIDGLRDDMKLSFAGDLTFYRLKRWGDDEYVLEFNEAQAYLSKAFRANHPEIQVAFMRPQLSDGEEIAIAPVTQL